MTKMLASVNSSAEALVVLNARVDIIDLKQPASGALGALPLYQVTDIVNTIAQRCLISATIGDIPLQAHPVFNAVQAMATTGVDYIKIGFFPQGDITKTLATLMPLTTQVKLIAVLFADAPFELSLLTALKQAGFVGVMVDTMNKQHGSLTQLCSAGQLHAFVYAAKQAQLLCGLAGSLRFLDIAPLMNYQADYLGFRGALCSKHNRLGELDVQAINKIRQAIS